MIDLRPLAERWLQWAWSLSWQFALLVVLVAITCRVLPSRVRVTSLLSAA